MRHPQSKRLLVSIHDVGPGVASQVGQLSDLLESLLKRHAQVKDSGSIFPGHGGLMDRLDSVFAALPIFAAGLWLLQL